MKKRYRWRLQIILKIQNCELLELIDTLIFHPKELTQLSH